MMPPSDECGRAHLTPEQILARHLTPLRPPLTEDEGAMLVEAGLVREEELVVRESPTVGASGLHWTYEGDRWGLIYERGRPVLVPPADAWKEPLTPMQRVEREFAVAVLVSELVSGYAATDDDIAELHAEPPWSLSFAKAAICESTALIDEVAFPPRTDRHE